MLSQRLMQDALKGAFMKKLSMLLVAVLVMIIGFAGCKQESYALSPMVTWEESTFLDMELSVYSDNTWKLIDVKQGAASVDYAKGTYTGDATEDGVLSVKVTHKSDSTSQPLKELTPPKEIKFTISESGKILHIPTSLVYEEQEGTIKFKRK